MKFRPVKKDDYQAIWQIYNNYIQTPITFEFEMPDLVEFEERLDNITKEYPCIVCEVDGEILGYAYAHRFAERAGYNWTAELSVYTDPRAKGLGLGRQLYEKMLKLSELQGIRTVFGIVSQDNESSEKLHEKLGFKLAGVFQNVGFKDGQWLSCSYYAKEIGPYDQELTPIVNINEIAADKIASVLE